MKASGGSGDQEDYEEEACERPQKKSNSLPTWGNEKTMNLNPLILTNIQSSQYFKVNLYQLKTYHEVIDEIYYQVNHLEPWEKGSRKTSGQTGMCGGVRGVGAGGIVSTAFCILYKLYTLKLTRKQVLGLVNHSDSPYIRGLGFMYIRFTQPPADLWDWFEAYLDDEEEIDVRAGGGQTSTIGTIVRHMLSKLEWHSTLFPRIPVPIQKDIEKKLNEKAASKPVVAKERYSSWEKEAEDGDRRRTETNGDLRKSREKDVKEMRPKKDDARYRERDKEDKYKEKEGEDRDRNVRDREDKYRERDRDRDRERGKDKSRYREREETRSRDRDRERGEKERGERDRERRERRDHHHHHHYSRSHHRERSYGGDYAHEIEKEKERIRRDKRKSRSRSQSQDRDRDRDRRRKDY